MRIITTSEKRRRKESGMSRGKERRKNLPAANKIVDIYSI